MRGNARHPRLVAARRRECSLASSERFPGTRCAIPLSARFEHTHIVGGSGHGKTQLLQSLLLRDIEQLKHGRGSIVVIDSQGDLIKTILGLGDISDLSDRIVLIDPNDIEYPPCLNLFDFGLERLTRYARLSPAME